ncbi:MAG TPA: acyl-CoA dehydrogenase C-terminal domain-containing protein [Steroidobacteraceae bacterium]|nr:acyl-CoA dehydrogenase C-terminal domain-containing protein [Steroidobacteraceae bacterium]
MSDYQAPLKQIRFTIEQLADFSDVVALPDFTSVDGEMAGAVLEEAGRFASGVLAPTNWLADQQAVQVVDRAVRVPTEVASAYTKFREGGWSSIGANPEFGGQGLPKTVAIACDEMWAAANVAFALCPELSQGAILALDRHASEELKKLYLEKLISGQWTGTMCLTEPQAGSDLSTVASKAVPHGDRYLISGRKIFITWGDHSMTENIVHLTLARLPDAPPGTKGISLFVVPKFKLNPDGTPGERNDVFPVSVEHKLGIHGSPTCVMAFGDAGGAEGFLVGKPNEGLAAMFTMMNYMRLGVGAQGVGLADRAYQKAVSFSRERKQGRAPGAKGIVPIIRHPDIRRTLLLMRSLTQASRAIVYYTACCLDRGLHGVDAEAAAFWQTRGELMTPVAKAWTTEVGQEVTSLGMQVHGGMGYIEETGAAQFYRDARILPIYEGTNGIHAIDLVVRKLPLGGGRGVVDLIGEIAATAVALQSADDARLQAVGARLEAGAAAAGSAAGWLTEHRDQSQADQLAGATPYLKLLGDVIGGWMLGKGALVAAARLAAGEGPEDFYRGKIALARFYAEQTLALAPGMAEAVVQGADVLAITAEALGG